MEKGMIKRGWHLTPEGQEQCAENGDKSANSAIKKALNLDLKTIGEKWLPTDVSTGRIKADFLEGPAVLQMTKLRNVSAPKDNEESQAAPRLWKITLTDGHATVAAVCLEPLKNLGLKTPPGTKLLLEGKADILNGYLLLSNRNCQLLGGHVPNLVESWQLKLKLAQQSRVGIQSEGGPPPFVPFGKKMSKGRVEAPERDDFKSLGASSLAAGGEEEENSEFQQQRQATIAEAEALASKSKTFGGGQKSSLKDSDVARIVEMGFTADQAGSALRQSGGDVMEAIGKLLGGHVDGWGEGFGQGRSRGGGGRGRGIRERGGEHRQEEEERGARRGGRRDGRRRGRGGEEEDEDEEGVSGRPSGPSTLFDFLETKIPAKSDKKSVGKQRPGSGQEPRYHADQRTDQRPYTASGDGRSSSPRPPYPRLDRGQDSAKPSRQEREMKDPQGGWNQTSEKEIKWSGRGQRGAQNGAQEESQPAHVSSNRNDRGNRSRNNRPSQNNENHPKQAPHQPAQNVNRSDRNDTSKPDQSSQPDRQKRYHQNSDSQQNGRDFQRGPRSDQRHSRPFREQHANMEGPSSEERVDRHYPQSGANRADRRAGNQRGQSDYGQKGSSRQRLRRGSVVLAKYWEDNQLYQAMVEAVAENQYTAVVTFLDYGNQEEVLCADIHPIQDISGAPADNSQGWFPDSRQFGAPDPYAPASNAGLDSEVIPQMEFRRGGSWQGHRQQGQDNRRRPAQNFYTPPNYKK